MGAARRRPLQNELRGHHPCPMATRYLSLGLLDTTLGDFCHSLGGLHLVRLTATLCTVTKPKFHLSYPCSFKIGDWCCRWGAPK